MCRSVLRRVVKHDAGAGIAQQTKEKSWHSSTNSKDGPRVLLISHRFSTVRTADRIIVLHEGEIVEEGTHATLMARNGRYAEMFTLQAKAFAS